MSAHEVENLIACGLLSMSYVLTMYALPTWITRRCQR